MSHQKRTDWRGAVIGMAMGDGHLFQGTFRNGERGGNYMLEISHCAKQLEYLERKRDIVNEIFEYDIPIRRVKVFDKTHNKAYNKCRIVTRVHPRLTFIGRRVYKDRRKQITQWVLDNLTTEGLAYWWMDDGCIHLDKRDGHGGGQLIWATYGFDVDQVKLLKEWIADKYGASFNLLFHKNGGPYLKRGISGCTNLIDAMRPYSVPCMNYKFDIGSWRRPFYDLKPQVTAPATPCG